VEDRFVVDTSALLSWPLTELNGAIIVQSQVKELERHSPARAEMVEAVGVIISEPTGDSISSASVEAMETGDMGGLSITDLHLVALAYERNCVLVTDDYRMQNLSERMGVRWKSVSSDGISEFWIWKVKCVGCGREFDSPESPTNKKGLLGECMDCGSDLKLKRG
tara:strand:+ start:89 stop:583 length:495 start_codon:yes stop_codon:yes gene_type:complete